MVSLKKPLRQNVALAVDGGGIKGVMVARALRRLEEAVGQKVTAFVRLTSGTSTGAIIAAAVARGLDAETIETLYTQLGSTIFRKSGRTLPLIQYLVRYQYDTRLLTQVLAQHLGDQTIGDLYNQRPDFHMVLTATDIYANQTRFIKLYKPRYAGWMLRDAVMASSIVPTVFPVFPHRYATPDMPPDPDEAWIPEPRYWVDGGVGSYSNPCYMAAYEIAFCLNAQGWRLDNTTLISLGTGNDPMPKVWKKRLGRRTPNRLFGPEWVFPTVDTFLHEAAQQQVRLVRHFFVDAPAERAGDTSAGLDFRRYNVDFDEAIGMDDAAAIPKLIDYGEKLAQVILDDVQEDAGEYSCGEPAVSFSMHAPGGGSAQVV
jgi:predicted acylesterase/phospholipase RssA